MAPASVWMRRADPGHGSSSAVEQCTCPAIRAVPFSRPVGRHTQCVRERCVLYTSCVPAFTAPRPMTLFPRQCGERRWTPRVVICTKSLISMPLPRSLPPDSALLVLSLMPEKHARLASSSTRMTGSPTHSRSTTAKPSRSILVFMPRPSANSGPGRRGNPSAQSHSCSTSGGAPHRDGAKPRGAGADTPQRVRLRRVLAPAGRREQAPGGAWQQYRESSLPAVRGKREPPQRRR